MYLSDLNLQFLISNIQTVCNKTILIASPSRHLAVLTPMLLPIHRMFSPTVSQPMTQTRPHNTSESPLHLFTWKKPWSVTF